MAHIITDIIKSNKHSSNSYCDYMLTSGPSDFELFMLSNNQYGIMETYTVSAFSTMFKFLFCHLTGQQSVIRD